MYLRLPNPKVTSSPCNSHGGVAVMRFPFLEQGCCHIAVILVALHASVRMTTVQR